MKIKLSKNHKYKNYLKNNAVSVCCKDCANKNCFSPHNWSYRRTDGKLINDFRCNTREHHGCPDMTVLKNDSK